MTARITELAKVISDSVALVEGHLQEKNEPQPSFGITAPKKVQTTGEAEIARHKAIAAASELVDLLKGPAELLRFDWTENASLRLILKFKLAEIVPIDKDISFADVAQKADLPERDVRRILRHAMTRHIFIEPRKGFVAHTALSRLLAEDEQQLDITSTCAEVLWPASYSMADAVKKWPGSEEANETGFSVALGDSKQTMWQKFSENQEMGRQFGVFIGEGGANESLLNDVDWKGKVVDIGGSQGDVMIDILKRHSQVTEVVVQDLADVVEAGQRRAPHELGDKLRFKAHDFFKPQTETADIFFLRWIFHNWSNKYSVQILRNLIPAMKPGTKIIVNDFLLPEPNTLPWALERAIRSVDLTMLALLNATERDSEGWHDLFHEADPRFQIQSIKMMPPGIMAIIEVEWKP